MYCNYSLEYQLTQESKSQALYHALPMNYVSAAKLQNKLEGEANQADMRKIIRKMTLEGFIEAKSSKRLGIK